MKTKKRVAAVALVAASVLGGTVAGAVIAAPPAADAQEATDGEVTDTTRATRIRQALDVLVVDGTLTEAQADAVADTLAESMPDRRGHRHHRGARVAIESAADAIGISVDDLVAELRGGATIAEVAGDNDVDAESVIDAIVATAGEHLADAVADGRLSDDEAAERLAGIEERAADMVNGEFEPGVRRGRRGAPGGDAA